MSIPFFALSRRVFVDTSAYVALSDRRDDRHEDAKAILSRLSRERRFLFTTNFVLAETHSLLVSRIDYKDAALHVSAYSLSAGTTVVRVSKKDETRAWAIIQNYVDKDFSLVDAMSFAVMERLHIISAFTFDQHFSQYNFTMLNP